VRPDAAEDPLSGESGGRGLSTIHVIADALIDEQFDFGGHSSPDGTITLLLTDIEQAAELLEDLGEPASTHLLRDHNALVHQLVEGYGGEIVRGQDDGFLVRFVSAHAALHCALKLRDAFTGLPLPLTGAPLRIRIGLHTGHIISAEGTMFGRNVVLAARIADYARGGEILVSSVLKEYTENDLRFVFEDARDVHFKGVTREHRIYSVAWRSSQPR
jgi:adenylate cyclase